MRPSKTCRTHLNSCHGEIHQEIAYVQRYGPTSKHLGHVALGQFIPERVDGRHFELAHEIDHRAKQSRTAGGHNSDLDEKIATVDAGLFGFPVEALKLYQRNVFRCKDCDCMTKSKKVQKVEVEEDE